MSCGQCHQCWTKCIPDPSGLELGMGANNPIPEKCTVMKQGRRPRPIQVCSTSKQEEIFCYYFKMQVSFWIIHCC
jgi:hypothetical protein